MRLPLITLWLLAPLLTFAQTSTLTGRITNAETGVALPRASVFLTETSYGTSSNDDGTFNLKVIKPGKYLLVVSMVGFEVFNQNVTVGSDASPLTIKLKPQVTALREVSIKLPEDWERNYKIFLKRFVGTSSYYGRKCKILNSEVLNLKYDKKEGALLASSDGMILMENRTLGYLIKILLTKSSFYSYGGYWYAQFFFEDLPGTPEEIKKWQAKRLELLRDTDILRFVAAEKLPSDFR